MAHGLADDDGQDGGAFIIPSSLSSPLIPQSVSGLTSQISGLSDSIKTSLNSPLPSSIESIAAPIHSISESLNQQSILGGSMLRVGNDGLLRSPYDIDSVAAMTTNFFESESDREARENREEMEKNIKQLRDELQSKTSTQEVLARLTEIEDGFQKEKESSTPEATLARLPNQLPELSKHCRAAELDLLKDYFLQNCFFWKCGLGHLVEKVTTLPQLKRIVEEQIEGKVRKCNKSHLSYLLVTNRFLLAISVTDFKGGMIHGGQKTNARNPGRAD